MRREKILFEEALIKLTEAWKYTGIQIDYDNEAIRLTFLGHLRKRWYYVANFICLTTAALSVFGLINELSIEKILFMVPCMTFSFLGSIKSFFFLYYENEVRDVINTLRDLQTMDEAVGKEIVVQAFVKEHLAFLNSATSVLRVSSYMAVATFCIGPVMVIGWQYWSTREINLFLPYTVWYPFDAYTYIGWPFAYVHQFWSAWLAIFFVHGPDCFYYISCAFIYNQFCSLQFDMAEIGSQHFSDQTSFIIHIGNIVYRHRELIRCVDMMNVIFGKSSLYNVVSSSLLICLAGFNVTAIENLILMTPFAVFIVVTSVQIFLLCYYGDLLMRASQGVSDAVFSSQWYNLNATSMKYCLFIIMRAQKHCKITAFGFRNINLNTFGKILSSAWSYFTLINTMYSKTK